MSHQEQNQNKKINQVTFNWWGISSTCCCVLLSFTIFIVIRMLWDNKRYELASQALNSGNTQIALAALLNK